MLCASLILLVLMGSRQAQGLFLSPINTATQIGIVPLSLALALGHFFWGFIQPIAGWIADKYGSRRVLVAGILLYSTGLILTTFAKNAPVLIFSLGFISAIGAGAASFSVLIGSVNQHVPENKRGLAAGIINAGSSLGQFIFAPLSQFFITSYGWQGAMLIVSAIAAVTAMLVIPLSNKQLASEKALNISQQGLRSTIFPAFRNKSYILLHMGFFTCGFHIAFLSTHLPGEVQLCGQSATVASWALGIIGLSNVVGSLTIGWLTQFFRSKFLLAIMYGSRALLIFVYLTLTKNRADVFLVLDWIGVHLVGYSSTNRKHRRKTIWSSLPLHAIWPNACYASNRSVSRCVPWWDCDRDFRELSRDVVRRRSASDIRRTTLPSYYRITTKVHRENTAK